MRSLDKSSSVSPENPRKKKVKFDDEDQLSFNFTKYSNHITKSIQKRKKDQPIAKLSKPSNLFNTRKLHLFGNGVLNFNEGTAKSKTSLP